MQAKGLVVLSFLLTLTPSLFAETIIRYPSGETRVLNAEKYYTANNMVLAQEAMSNEVNSSWVAPFSLDTTDVNGITTLLALHRAVPIGGFFINDPVSVTVEYFDQHGLHSAGIIGFSMRPLETQTLSSQFLDAVGGSMNFIPDSDGIARGFIRITGPVDLNVDFFQANIDDGFANGDVAINGKSLECWGWKVRFFNGGPFAGGAEISFLFNNPRGTVSGAPPTARVWVYSEGGALIGSGPVEIYTNEVAMVMAASDLVPNPNEPFGTMEVELNATSGVAAGHVRNIMTGDGRFSVDMNGVCINPGLHP